MHKGRNNVQYFINAAPFPFIHSFIHSFFLLLHLLVSQVFFHMQLIFLLLFSQIVLSNPLPNILARILPSTSDTNPLEGVSSSSVAPHELTEFYTVYPLDPDNQTEVAATEAFLRTLPDGEDVLANKNSNRTLSWRITVKDEKTITNELKSHDGIRKFEEDMTPPHPAHDQPLEARAIPSKLPVTYSVILKDPDNDAETDATRDYLKSIVTDKDFPIIEFHQSDGKVFSFAMLTLDEADLDTVRNRPGIMMLDKDPAEDELEDYFIEGPEKEEHPGFFQGALQKRTEKMKRALGWTKQVKAPKDLVMDSQPK